MQAEKGRRMGVDRAVPQLTAAEAAGRLLPGWISFWRAVADVSRLNQDDGP
jgi:hypothetical protein